MLSYNNIIERLCNFLEYHKILHSGLEYEIVENAKELEYEVANSFVGGYIPSEKTVVIIANRIDDYERLEKVLKHEIFGHAFLDFLSQVDKKTLLSSIIKESSAVFDDELNRISKTASYKHLTKELKSEEIFSFIAENIKINPNHNFTPFGPKLDGSTKEKIENIIQNLAAGIRENKLSLQKENIIQKSQDKGMSR